MSDVENILNWAIATIDDELTFGMDESESLKFRLNRARGAMREALEEIQELKEREKMLVKALEFYAKPESWEDGGDNDYTMDRIGFGDTDIPDQCCDQRGGKLARETLEKLKEQLNDTK